MAENEPLPTRLYFPPCIGFSVQTMSSHYFAAPLVPVLAKVLFPPTNPRPRSVDAKKLIIGKNISTISDSAEERSLILDINMREKQVSRYEQ